MSMLSSFAIPLSMIALVSFSATYATMPWLIKALSRVRITGKDLHKSNVPEIPAMGGIGIFAGVAAAMTLSGIMFLDYRFLFAIFLTGTLAVLAGLLDDLFKLGKRTLVILTFLLGIPVIAFRAGSTVVYLSPFGPTDLGLVFWIGVPFAFAFLMNGVNIYAGFNGLEAGLGLVSSLSLAICAFVYGSSESAVALFALGGALLAFLKWNWFPSRVFIGGSGTYLVGAILAGSIIVGSIKIAGTIALFPYFLNFLLRALDRFTWSVGETLPDGRVTSKSLRAVWALFIHKSPTTERGVVIRCLLLQAIFGLFAVAFAYYHVNFVIAGLGR